MNRALQYPHFSPAFGVVTSFKLINVLTLLVCASTQILPQYSNKMKIIRTDNTVNIQSLAAV